MGKRVNRTRRTVAARTLRTLSAGLAFACLAAALPGPARAEGYAGQAGAFLRMGAGAVAVAAGDAGVARAVGVEQAHYNPAGLPYAPASEVAAGYHVLSLDRRLAHVGLLAQLPRLATWTVPIRLVAVAEPAPGDSLPRLVDPTGLHLAARREFRAGEIVQPVAEAVAALLKAGESTSGEPVIVIDGERYDAGVLAPVIRETASEARRRGLETTGQVLALLRERYGRVQIKPAAVALTWTHAGTGDIEARDFDGDPYATLGYWENRFALSFGVKLHDKVSFGLTAGVLYALVPDILEDFSSNLTSTTFGADAGVQVRPFLGGRMPWRLETLVFGAALYGIGAKNTWNTTGLWSRGTTKTDRYPTRARFGLACRPVTGLETFFDLETDFDLLLRPKGGVELTLVGLPGTGDESKGEAGREALTAAGGNYGLSLRAGVDRDRPTFGFGLEFRLAGLGLSRLDYAYVIEPVSPEATQVVSWRFRLAR